jgi:hypothetical protein
MEPPSSPRCSILLTFEKLTYWPSMTGRDPDRGYPGPLRAAFGSYVQSQYLNSGMAFNSSLVALNTA